MTLDCSPGSCEFEFGPVVQEASLRAVFFVFWWQRSLGRALGASGVHLSLRCCLF